MARKKKESIPRGHLKFDAWLRNIIIYLEPKVKPPNPPWAHIPPSEVDALIDEYTLWGKAFSATQGPCTKADRTNRDIARKSMEKFIRNFIKFYLRLDPPVTDADRDNMGIHNYDTQKTPIGDPTAIATGDLYFPGPGLVEIVKIRILGITSDDPRAEHGVRIYWGVLDSVNPENRITFAPESSEDLPHSDFTRRQKYLFDFTADRGKKVWFSYRYQNEKGGKGPFSPMQEATIP